MGTRRRLGTAIPLLVLVPLLQACSLFGPRMQTITVSSDPSGAVVAVNGSQVGRTPLRHQVHRGEDLLVEVRRPGYRTEYRTSHRTLSSLGILDVVGGAVLLLPFLGLLSPAAWEHDPATFGVLLEKDEGGEGP